MSWKTERKRALKGEKAKREKPFANLGDAKNENAGCTLGENIIATCKIRNNYGAIQ